MMEDLNEQVRQLLAKAIRACITDFEATERASFYYEAEEFFELEKALGSAADPRMQSVVDFMDDYFDSASHGFREFNGVSWTVADAKLHDILWRLDNGLELPPRERLLGRS